MLQLSNLTSRSHLQTGCWPSHRPPSDFPHTQSHCKINTSIPPLSFKDSLLKYFFTMFQILQKNVFCFLYSQTFKTRLKHFHASQTFSVFTQDKYRHNFAAAKERWHICSFLAAVMKHEIVQRKLLVPWFTWYLFRLNYSYFQSYYFPNYVIRVRGFQMRCISVVVIYSSFCKST